MEYSDYISARKRLEVARKFVRISRTILENVGDSIGSDIGHDDLVRLNGDAISLTDISDRINECIGELTFRFRPDRGEQLDLFNMKH